MCHRHIMRVDEMEQGILLRPVRDVIDICNHLIYRDSIPTGLIETNFYPTGIQVQVMLEFVVHQR